ncbi:hypothetical protein C8R45DRAFT_936813 [Mycena sanguinolenta]|nr:hypothetical protein C8R45DRAFT_936813 [Mycena sanguinolenta]
MFLRNLQFDAQEREWGEITGDAAREGFNSFSLTWCGGITQPWFISEALCPTGKFPRRESSHIGEIRPGFQHIGVYKLEDNGRSCEGSKQMAQSLRSLSWMEMGESDLVQTLKDTSSITSVKFVDLFGRMSMFEHTGQAYMPTSTTIKQPHLSPYQERIFVDSEADKHALLLGLVIAFRTPPSVDQIARVARLSPEKVQIMLARTPGLLINDPSSDLLLSKNFVVAILQTYRVDLAAAHERLACWCLKFLDMRNVRDIAYATHNWAHHASRAEATPNLIDALRDLAFPLVTISTEQLMDVTFWLKNRKHVKNGVHARIVQFEALLQAKAVEDADSIYIREWSSAHQYKAPISYLPIDRLRTAACGFWPLRKAAHGFLCFYRDE